MSEGIEMKLEGGKTLAQIQAEVAAFEANPVDPGAPNDSPVPTLNATAPATPPEKGAPLDPAKPPLAEDSAKPAQQPKETTEKVASETPKAAEPVKDDTDWKKRFLDTRKKLNEVIQEKADVESKTETERPLPAAPTHEFPYELSQELRKQLDSDSEKDVWGTVDKLIRTRVNQIVTPIASKFAMNEAQERDNAISKSLDSLVSEGHDWLKTEEGWRKINSVIEENGLQNTRDPYRAAMGFIPDISSKAGQRGQAQSTGLTPILGASAAVPPVVSTPVVSKVDMLTGLLGEIEKALARGDVKKAQKIQAQMDEIERG